MQKLREHGRFQISMPGKRNEVRNVSWTSLNIFLSTAIRILSVHVEISVISVVPCRSSIGKTLLAAIFRF